MNYRFFGRSGLRISELALGTMTFGEAWNWGAPQKESEAILDAFLDRGGNFVDTANVYTNGESEAFLGAAMGARRGRIVLSTKYTLARGSGDPNSGGSQRKNLRESIDESLRRLGTDYIDIYWVHIRDKYTPAEEVMRALDDAVRAGKILYVGISDAPAWWVSRANTLAEWRDWTAFAGIQVQYNLIERTSERELIPMAEALDLAICAWSPLAGGALTGKYLEQQTDKAKQADESSRFRVAPGFGTMMGIDTNRALAIAQAVYDTAWDLECLPHQVALAWMRQQPFQVPVIPIIGARSVAQLTENMDCINVTLSEEQMQRLNAISAITMGFPHDFAAGVLETSYGDQVEKLRPHRAVTA